MAMNLDDLRSNNEERKKAIFSQPKSLGYEEDKAGNNAPAIVNIPAEMRNSYTPTEDEKAASAAREDAIRKQAEIARKKMMEDMENETSTKEVNIPKSVSSDQLTSVDPSEFLPKKITIEPNEEENPMFKALDAAISRDKEKVSKTLDDLGEKQLDFIMSHPEEAAASENVEGTALKDEPEVAEEAKSSSMPEEIIDFNKETEEDNFVIPTRKFAPKISAIDASAIIHDDNDEDLKKEEEKIFSKDVPITDEDTDNDKSDDKASDLTEEEQKLIVKNMLTELKQTTIDTIKPIKNVIDFGSFKISKKPISVARLMKIEDQIVPTSIADWALLNTGRPVSMTGLSGPEIIKLNPANSNRTRLNMFKEIYQIMYTHLHDNNKPEFEAWLKTVKFSDIDHLYFAMYMATFAGNNFLNFSCPNTKCNHVFLSDVKFEDMVKYSTPETKKYVASLLQMDTTTKAKEYELTMHQISDDYVAAVRSPSIYSAVIENASLSEAFMDKYSDLIDIIAYVEDIYFIDSANGQLIPIDMKPVANDQVQTSANRIQTLNTVMKKLTSDQYYDFLGYTSNIDDEHGSMAYQIPEMVCPKCGTKIPAREIDPSQLLFLRHRLGAYKNISTM